MKLTETEPNREYRMISLSWGKQLQQRLFEMGLTINCAFTVIVNTTTGPVLIELRGTRLAIGNGMASKIEVEIIS